MESIKAYRKPRLLEPWNTINFICHDVSGNNQSQTVYYATNALFYFLIPKELNHN